MTDKTASRLRSPAFTHEGPIPARYTCEGEGIPPALEWSGVPERAAELALVIEDPDAPDPRAPKRTYVHWIVLGLSPQSRGLPEGGAPLPPGAREGLNDAGDTGYVGMCPPIGRHRYFFRLYALSKKLDAAHPKRAELTRAMEGHVLAVAELMGTYEARAER